MSYIRYSVPNAKGVIYATLVDSVRNGNKIEQKYIANLGRVVNRGEGIFKSRERGVYKFTLDGGYSAAPPDAIPSDTTVTASAEKEKLILDFGDSYVLDQYIQTLPFYQAYQDMMPAERDTLFSLLFYRMLTEKKAYCYADSWWSGNYVTLLYPKARLHSQRISEFLASLGEENVQRRFFADYLSAIYGRNNGTTGILIDSTGLENASRMPITQLNNHNGDINLEIRLFYVIDRQNGMPVYFRYCPGNIVDVSTLCTTMSELSQYGIAIDYAIVDAGYFSEDNVRELYKNKVHFVTRLAPNRKLYKEVAAKEMPDILSPQYALRYGNRLVYIKKTKIDVYGNPGYAYLGIDMDSRNQQYKRAMFNALEDKLSLEETNARIAKLGAFMLLSSDEMEPADILPLYYTRQQVEQVFDIGKNNADIVPLRVQNEKTFRGHLMLTFMATAVLQRLQKDILKKRKKNDKTNPEGAFMKLRNQKCKVYQREIIPQEPVKEVNEVYKLLKVDLPTSISRAELM
ncbi:transposase [Eisenbergiella porci]|uniref:transposase n=1 Tax=Eisenbergiella porci TaxID=2652274 RepID=UPI002A7FE706|nr:transposase [Eisenbergiella porci]